MGHWARGLLFLSYTLKPFGNRELLFNPSYSSTPQAAIDIYLCLCEIKNYKENVTNISTITLLHK